MKDRDATDLFFIDADVGFDAAAVIRLLKMPQDIVAGIYPLKKDEVDYPVRIKRVDGVPIGQGGLVEAELLPTGFMRIKRSVFQVMQEKYPKLKYKPNIVNVAGADVEEVYDFFNMGMLGSSEWTTEDFAFCQRWTDLGGQLWVSPDIDFTHVGNKAFKGNYHNFLLGATT
jgi:hypothetical protein